MHSKSADGGHRSQLIRQLQYLGQMQSTETAHFHQTAASINGLNITDSKTLSVLMQEGPMTAGQLALRRRKVIVVINHKKTALLGKTYDSIGASFTKLLGRYSTEQLEFLTGFMQSAIELSKQETYKLTGPR
jgi:hypothetical protein